MRDGAGPPLAGSGSAARTAGPALDALIAKNVMGIQPTGRPSRYSTDIAVAWQVLQQFPDWSLFRFSSTNNYVVDIYPDVEASADTAPLAVCRAALQAAEA